MHGDTPDGTALAPVAIGRRRQHGFTAVAGSATNLCGDRARQKWKISRRPPGGRIGTATVPAPAPLSRPHLFR